MATFKAPRTISKRGELRKDAATTLFARIQEAYTQHRRLAAGGAVTVAVLVFGFIGYQYLQAARGAQADEALGAIILTYEAEDYRTALDGSGAALGLLDIIDRYGSTPAGRLARFYAGDALFRLGDYDQAAELFGGIRGKENIVGASALAGEAAVNETNGSFEAAADLYRDAALADENAIWSPGYMHAAARAFERAGELAQAEEILQMMQDRYPSAERGDEVEFLLARVRAQMRKLPDSS